LGKGLSAFGECALACATLAGLVCGAPGTADGECDEAGVFPRTTGAPDGLGDEGPFATDSRDDDFAGNGAEDIVRAFVAN
jgi:hypothetical protein